MDRNNLTVNEPVDMVDAIRALPTLPQGAKAEPGMVIAAMYEVDQDGLLVTELEDDDLWHIVRKPDPTPEERLASWMDANPDDIAAALAELGYTLEPKPKEA